MSTFYAYFDNCRAETTMLLALGGLRQSHLPSFCLPQNLRDSLFDVLHVIYTLVENPPRSRISMESLGFKEQMDLYPYKQYWVLQQTRPCPNISQVRGEHSDFGYVWWTLWTFWFGLAYPRSWSGQDVIQDLLPMGLMRIVFPSGFSRPKLPRHSGWLALSLYK